MMLDIDTQEQNKLSGKPLALELKLKTQCVDLASDRVGGETLSCSDDFFAEMENLLKAGRGVFIDDKFTDRGKWMDGWESRRSYGRDNGREFDWCIIRLGIQGVIRGFDIDTNYFRGNAPEKVSIEACVSDVQPNEHTLWHTVLKEVSVDAHSQNIFSIDSENKINGTTSWTHVRLNMFPDGGIARLRVYGEANVDWNDFVDGELIDLAYIKNGAKALLVSDMFFSDKNNLIMPGRGKDMGDGWETRRRREPGNDWCVIALGHRAEIKKLLVDTAFFKGNYPDRCSIQAINAPNLDSDQDNLGSDEWQTLLPEQKLEMDAVHEFEEQIINMGPITHLRLNIFPDGGVSRLNVFGLLA